MHIACPSSMSSSTNGKRNFEGVNKRWRLLSIKHLFKYLGASTSIEMGNNNEIDNGIKKYNINDEADKSDSEQSQKAAFCRRW